MKGKIIDNPWSSDVTINAWLKAHAGQWVDIDTAYLFTDQYNVDAYRLYDTHFQAMQDDARIGKGKCRYCGKLISTGDICLEYGACPGVGIEWWTEKNCFFLANPDGLQMPAEFEPIKIGTYTLELNYGKEHWTLRNMRKRIDFKFNGERFWVVSIGYIGTKSLDVPLDVLRKLIVKLKELQPVKA